MNGLIASFPWSIPAVLTFAGIVFTVRQARKNKRQDAKDAAVAAARAANMIAPPTAGEVWNRMDELEAKQKAADQRADAAEDDRNEIAEKLEKVAVELDAEKKSSALYRSAAGRYFAKLFAALNGARLAIPEPDDEDRAILELTLTSQMKNKA